VKKKAKHIKQQDATHPINESECIKEILERMANPGESTKLEYDKTLRKLTPSDATAETSGIRLDKKDSSIW